MFLLLICVVLFFVFVAVILCLLLFVDCCSLFCFFFFFKQKTAYEMRISDWSSDVCSSDLRELLRRIAALIVARHVLRALAGQGADKTGLVLEVVATVVKLHVVPVTGHADIGAVAIHARRSEDMGAVHRHALRSEEHTSELQSLMRNSYAVFCLKHKT